jgi:recombination associated protein RdgC
VRYQRHPLEAKEIKTHLSAGKVVTRLGLTWNDRIAFALTDKLQLKRIEFLEIAEDSLAKGDSETEITPEEKFATDFALMTGEFVQLLKDIFAAIGGVGENRAAA